MKCRVLLHPIWLRYLSKFCCNENHQWMCYILWWHDKKTFNIYGVFFASDVIIVYISIWFFEFIIAGLEEVLRNSFVIPRFSYDLLSSYVWLGLYFDYQCCAYNVQKCDTQIAIISTNIYGYHIFLLRNNEKLVDHNC